jgi:hypothetical protein
MIFTIDMWKIRNQHQAYFAFKLETISFYDALQAVRNEEVNFSLKYCMKTYMCAIK